MVDRNEIRSNGLEQQNEPEELSGEVAGEIGIQPSQPFFVSKKAAAVLKHGILRRYVKPWASKVGSTAHDRRVVYLDGYAGPGRYDDGTDGSPALILRTAQSMDYRNFECHFVEKKRNDYARLRNLVDQARTNGVSCEAYKGRLEDLLDQILSVVGDAPLFAFLDPFGLAIPFEDITGKIMGGSRSASTGRKTEILMNFSANAVRRIGPFLDPDCSAPNRDATLRAMDTACGGTWWRAEYAAHETNERRVQAIANKFMHLAAKSTQAGGWVFPVRNRATPQPVYALVYLSRHSDGMWLFGDSLARAQQEWRRHLNPPPSIDPDALFPLPDTFEEEEKARKDQWVSEIKSNVSRLLQDSPGFSIASKYNEVFGSSIGLANESIVRQAIKELHSEHVTGCDGKGKVSRFFITRWAQPSS